MAGNEKFDNPQEISAVLAREWWKSLMANACALVEDTAVLAEHSSPGRAQALVVLAMEELAKARWVYDAAQWEWTSAIGLYGQDRHKPGSIVVPHQLTTRRRPHTDKLAAAEQFAAGLGGFWNADRREEYYFPADLKTFESSAQRRNLDKQAGFYVDRDGETLLSPLAITAEGVDEFLTHAAQCVEMHLIEDHTRQQDAPDFSLVDSVQDLHWAILPIAHPDEFAAFLDRATHDDEPPNGEPTDD